MNIIYALILVTFALSSDEDDSFDEPEPEEVLQPFSLNIQIEEGNLFYSYKRVERFRIFTSHSGFGFNRLLMGNIVIWEGTDLGDKAEAYTSVKGEHHLAILHHSSLFTCFYRFRDDMAWEDVTSDKVDLSMLTMHNERGIPIWDFIADLDKMSYGYIVNPDIRCTQIRFKKRVVWDRNDCPRVGSVRTLTMDLLRDTIFMGFGGLVKRNLNIERSLHLFDGDSLIGPDKITKKRKGAEVNHRLRRRCTAVKFSNSIVWEQDPRRLDIGPHPNSVAFNRNTGVIDIRFNSFHILCKRVRGQWILERKAYR